jgi:hypothetical protein
LEQLAKRARGAVEAAQKNRYFETEWVSEYQELNEAFEALDRAAESLRLFHEAVRKRETIS